MVCQTYRLLQQTNGKLKEAKIEFVGEEEVEHAGGKVKARRYKVKGSREQDLWYIDEGWLLKRTYESSGGKVTYFLQ